MDVVLIDLGALAVFLASLALVYWQGVSNKARAVQRPAASRERIARRC